MNYVVVAALILIGCGSKHEPSEGSASGVTTERPSITDPLGFCERARVMMLRRGNCFPEDTSIKMGVDEIDGLFRSAPVDPQARRRVAVTCAIMLDGMMRAEQPKNCPLDVTDEETAELGKFLASWYGERTPAPKTGNASIDATLVKLAAGRDAACACKDLGCLRKVSADLDPGLPTDAPKPATDAAARIMDEVARCKQRLTTAR